MSEAVDQTSRGSPRRAPSIIQSEKDKDLRKSMQRSTTRSKANLSIAESIEDASVLLRTKRENNRDANYFQLQHAVLGNTAQPCEMAESQALQVANSVIELIIETGEQRLYEKFLQTKVKPFAAIEGRQICQSLTELYMMTNDCEPKGTKFDQMWVDEGEPVPPKAPIWMGEQIKVKQQTQMLVSVHDASSMESPRRENRLRLKKLNSVAMSSTIYQSNDGIINIQSGVSDLGKFQSQLDSSPDREAIGTRKQLKMLRTTQSFNMSNTASSFKQAKDPMNLSVQTKNSSRSKRSKKSTRKIINVDPQKHRQPEKLTDLPPRPPPLAHEHSLRNYIRRKQENKIEQEKQKVAEEEQRAHQLKELQKQQGRDTQSKQVDNEELYHRRMSQGVYAFSSQGQPMVVKRANPHNLPQILQKAEAGIDGVKVITSEQLEKEQQEHEVSSQATSSRFRAKKHEILSHREEASHQGSQKQSQMRVRPVTATLTAKKKVIKKHVSSVMIENQAQKEKIDQIAQEMELEIEAQRQEMEAAGEGTELGGLYQGIEEVAGNVTYIQDEKKIVGEKQIFDGKLSLQEYEAISMTETRKSQIDAMSHQKRNQDLLSVDAEHMVAIQEREDTQEEASIESIRLSTADKKRRFRNSPGRVIKIKGKEDQIQEMFATQPNFTLNANESCGFEILQKQVNGRYAQKANRLWSAVTRPGQMQSQPQFMSRHGSKQFIHSQFKQTKGSASNAGLNNNFYSGGSQVRYSLDKVITYDTTSLLDGMVEKEKSSAHKKAHIKQGMASVIPKLARPTTSRTATNMLQSVNEEFNQKLIEHGTDKGVPQSELPDPSSAFSSGHRALGSYFKRRQEGGTQASSLAGYASTYQLKQKQAARPPSGVSRKQNTLTSSLVVQSQGGMVSAIQEKVAQAHAGGGQVITPRNPKRRLISARYNTRVSKPSVPVK